MTRFVIGPDVALRLARERAGVANGHRLLAPSLLRSEVLSRVYQAVRRGEHDVAEGRRQLDHVRQLRIRLLGDRVLQDLAWRLADELGMADTLQAEYLALTRLQADAFVTLDAGLARAARRLVPLAPLAAMLEPG